MNWRKSEISNDSLLIVCGSVWWILGHMLMHSLGRHSGQRVSSGERGGGEGVWVRLSCSGAVLHSQLYHCATGWVPILCSQWLRCMLFTPEVVVWGNKEENINILSEKHTINTQIKLNINIVILRSNPQGVFLGHIHTAFELLRDGMCLVREQGVRGA